MATEALRRVNGAVAPGQILSIQGLSGGYGELQVLRDINLDLPEATVVGLLGRNGVGKTTLLRTLSGLLKASWGRVTFRGTDVTEMSPQNRAALGLCFIPEGRAVFRELTVEDNIRLFAPASMKGIAHDK